MRTSWFDRLDRPIPRVLVGWGAFLAALQPREVDRREDAPLYSPAIFFASTSRRNSNVEAVSFAVLDVDNSDQHAVATALAQLVAYGLTAVVHSTPSHSRALAQGLYKVRVIVPLAREAAPHEYQAIWRWLQHTCNDIGDEHCKDVSRQYYIPTAPRGELASAFCTVINPGGGTLDVEYAVRNAPAATEKTAAAAPDPEALERCTHGERARLCSEFLIRYPPAIQGEGGDKRTLLAAMAGGDFALEKEDFFHVFEHAYNPRCIPAWSRDDLWQKVINAYRYRTQPIGWRLVDLEKAGSLTARELKVVAKEARKDHKQGSRTLLAMIDGTSPVESEIKGVAQLFAKRVGDVDPSEIANALSECWSGAKGKKLRAAFVQGVAAAREQADATSAYKEQVEFQEEAQLCSDAFRYAGLNRNTPYSDDEVLGFARGVGLQNRHQWDRSRWVIQFGSSIYPWVGDRYVGPFGATNDAAAALPIALAPARLQLHKESRSGSRSPMKPTDVVQHYGTVAKGVIADMCVDRSYFDAQAMHIIESCAPLYPLAPVYNEDVNTWLRCLCGSDVLYNQLLDWLACITRLKEPICAVFLHGPAQTGKSLFAEALARLWRHGVEHGQPTKAERVHGAWTEDLALCPLVHADETVPKDSRGDPDTAWLRSIIVERSHRLTRKHKPNATLRGCIRLVISTNSPDVFINDRLNLTNHDVSAISERFLTIEVQSKARHFLESLPPNRALPLKAGFAIAQHALWLTQNRVVQPKGRLLVEGLPGSRLELHMLTSSGMRARVCAWIARWVLKKNQGGSGRHPVIDKGDLLITAKIVHENWNLFTHDENTPRISQVERALGGLSRGRRRVGDDQYRVVETEYVRYWATNSGECSDRQWCLAAAAKQLAVR